MDEIQESQEISTVEKIEHMTISTSKIRAAECPYYFKHDYSDRSNDKDATTPANLLTGRLAHKIIDAYDKNLIANHLTSDFELFRQIFEQEWENRQYIPESEYDDLNLFMTAFVEAHSLDLDHILGTEMKMAFDWGLNPVEYHSEAAWLRMILDNALYYPERGLAVATDYKTGRFMPSEGKQKKNLQTTVYPLGLFLANPHIDRVTMVFHYIRYNWKQTFEFSREDLKGLDDKLKGFTERMLQIMNNPKAEFPAIRGENCGICRLDCPLILMGVKPIQTKEYATQVAMQIEALKQKAKSLDGELKNYTQATGEEIETALGTYGWQPSETVKGLKASKVATVAMERGIDLDDCLSVDKKKIEKKLETEDKNAIMSLGKASMSTRYKLVKTAKDGEEDEE